MSSLPTGTVTFLFTDIEGSTKLARTFPDEWNHIQEWHDSLLEEAITTHRGHIFRTVGDEVNAVFESALEAVQAAAAVQRIMQTTDWGEIGSLRVRMGLHTGQAVPRGMDYVGYLTLSHVKRLMSAASGGQILVSHTTEAILRTSLPQDIQLEELGEHRLKDFERAEHIFQVIAQDLRANFPALKSEDSIPNNLPAHITSFIGREKEIGEVKELLSRERLVTLTGLGGCGKTRLALQAASQMLDHFPDGVFFVALAPIADPGLVASTIAQTLGVRETARKSILDCIKDYLQSKTILLMLDNFEQVIPAAPLVAELLADCKDIKAFVTSREGLRIRGEHEYPVPPLAFPDIKDHTSLESLAQYPAVELFIQRAQEVRPDFRITNDNAPILAEICSRLDGLPLAIELAAARIKVMPPNAMLTRLENALELLTGGARDLPTRQQTMRNTITWSYDLLNKDEQTLFRRLSVFVGGFTVEAVEAVAGDDFKRISLVDLLESLVDKSLIREVGSANGDLRFVMLEVLREFGLEQLKVNGELEDTHFRHVVYYLGLAEQAEASSGKPEQVGWLDRLEEEYANLRAALEWSKAAERGADICLRLAGALGYFWEARGYYSEGRDRLSAILAMETGRGRTAARAKLLTRAAELAYRQSDYLAVLNYAGKSLGIYRKLKDKQGTASALIKLGNAAVEVGDFAAAAGFDEEALEIWREAADKHGTSRALISLGWTALRSGDVDLAKTRLEEAFVLSSELEDKRYIGFELSGLGEVALRQGDTRRAANLVEESLEVRRQLGSKWGIGVCLGLLGWIAIREGDWDLARDRLVESLDVRQEIGDKSGTAWCLERLAEVAAAQGQAEKAARLLGAAEALRESIGSVIDPVDRGEVEERVNTLRDGLGAERIRGLWEEGRTMDLEEAAGYAKAMKDSHESSKSSKLREGED